MWINAHENRKISHGVFRQNFIWIYNYLTWRMYDSANSAVTHSSTFLSLQKLVLCKTMQTIMVSTVPELFWS